MEDGLDIEYDLRSMKVRRHWDDQLHRHLQEQCSVLTSLILSFLRGYYLILNDKGQNISVTLHLIS